MSRRLSVRISDQLAEGIEARARRLDRTRSAVVRDALTGAGLTAERDPMPFAELLNRAAKLRARQSTMTDVVALMREARRESQLRLRLMRLTVPFAEADLA